MGKVVPTFFLNTYCELHVNVGFGVRCWEETNIAFADTRISIKFRIWDGTNKRNGYVIMIMIMVILAVMMM